MRQLAAAFISSKLASSAAEQARPNQSGSKLCPTPTNMAGQSASTGNANGLFSWLSGPVRNTGRPLVTGATGQDGVLPVLIEIGDFMPDEVTNLEKG